MHDDDIFMTEGKGGTEPLLRNTPASLQKFTVTYEVKKTVVQVTKRTVTFGAKDEAHARTIVETAYTLMTTNNVKVEAEVKETITHLDDVKVLGVKTLEAYQGLEKGRRR